MQSTLANLNVNDLFLPRKNSEEYYFSVVNGMRIEAEKIVCWKTNIAGDIENQRQMQAEHCNI